MFTKLIQNINLCNDLQDFSRKSQKIDDFINSLPKNEIINLLFHIGIIPERIAHDSSAEKLFSKASDSLLSRTFKELGLKSTVLTERADSADVLAKSDLHNYTLVADAKAFRLSRTAKNQKDFKVEALSNWRKDNDYAILSSPYFQYPTTSSQIYQQSLNKNVCLLSWEHLIFLLLNNIKEDDYINLSKLWSFSNIHSQKCTVSDSKKCFISDFDIYFCQTIHKEISDFNQFLSSVIYNIQKRGQQEKQFWQNEELKIKSYSKEEAIKELLIATKIDNKIKQIDKYILGLPI